ncbi:DUF342 domain-containing protein [Desulfofalx alkaliphila]|uniref:DUF342 domain-containing protein n=1 Tax=Desulfofalx alkaliphila TaxID=105483 RepID=UPI0004E21639|nr:FapA family protein [Desulfofalx alkaliphila]
MGNDFVLNEKGKLVFPDGWERSVYLVPHSDITISINGQAVMETTEANAGDEILFSSNAELVEGKVKVKISDDRLKAFVQLEPAIRVLPALDVEVTSTGVFVKAVPLEKEEFTFEKEQVTQELQRAGVVYGIDNQAIADLVKTPSIGKVLVASGKEPVPGIDESVNVLFDRESTKRPQVMADGRVDFKQKRLASVELGQVLAVKTAGKEGEPGCGVDGQPLPAPEHKKISMVAGSGVVLQQDGLTAIASQKGLPSLKVAGNTWTFQVKPVFQVNEVNLSTGNLEFNGDIRINGDVAEGMSVFAAGNIDVGGAVYGAKLTALGNVSVGKNLIGSTINAGGSSQYLQDFKSKFKTLEESLKEIITWLNALKDKCAELNKPFSAGQMIVALINKKYQDTPKLVDELNSLLKKNQTVVTAELENLIRELVIKYRRLGWLKIQDIEEVDALRQRMLTVMTSIDSTDEKQGDVLISYAVNSTIDAAGNVHVCGRGCINTVINASGNVVIDSIFRGGNINCKGVIKINEVGSEMGVKTTLKTTGDAIKIEKAHQNVILTAGARIYTVNSTEYKVFFKEDDD